MGSDFSKINYYNINEIIDIAPKNNKYGHKLLLQDGSEKIIYLTEKEEAKFKSNIAYSDMFKPIIKCKYEIIDDIKNYQYSAQNEDIITQFTIDYNNGLSENVILNGFQLDLFWKLFQKTEKGKEIKKKLIGLK
jgi:hypothetical protein